RRTERREQVVEARPDDRALLELQPLGDGERERGRRQQADHEDRRTEPRHPAILELQAMPKLLLSFDFEDWHQLVHRRLGRPDWNRPHPAFAPQVNAVLDLLDELDARATFFFLGMTVENYPELVAEVVARGHEPASHGYAHLRAH